MRLFFPQRSPLTMLSESWCRRFHYYQICDLLRCLYLIVVRLWLAAAGSWVWGVIIASHCCAWESEILLSTTRLRENPHTLGSLDKILGRSICKFATALLRSCATRSSVSKKMLSQEQPLLRLMASEYGFLYFKRFNIYELKQMVLDVTGRKRPPIVSLS